MPLPRFVALTLIASLAGAACRSSEASRTPATSGGAAHAAADAPAPPAPRDTALERRADLARIEGSDKAKLWVVEVSDFQCPFCKEWHDSTYASIKRDYVDTGKIRFAYINFPLNIHRNAFAAAEAAMCVAAQNRFWTMHDALFQSQKQWEELADPKPVFDSLARASGADDTQYRACMTSHAMKPLIEADQGRASDSGVHATPSFLIGGKLLEGAVPADAFRKALDQALRAVAP